MPGRDEIVAAPATRHDETSFGQVSLSDMLMQSPAAICILRGPEHVFILANEQYQRLVGKRDLIGRTMQQVFPELESQGIFELLRRVYTTGEPFTGNEVPVQILRDDGTYVPEYYNFIYQPIRNAAGDVEDIFVQAVPVTGQVIAQRRLEAVLEQMPVGVVIADAPSARIVMGNSQVELILRHPVLRTESIEDYDQWIAFHADGDKVAPQEWPLVQAVTTGEITRNKEVLYRRGDGTDGWISLNAGPILDSRGQVIAGVVAFTDVTERRELLAAEREAREQAERAATRTAQLLSVTDALADAITQEDVAEAALSAAIATVGAVAGGLGVLSDDKDRLRRLAILGYPAQIVESTLESTVDELGPIGDTARTGEAIWIESNDELFARYPLLANIPERRQFGATASVPLMLGGRIIGVMSLRFASARTIEPEDRDLILAIAGQCAQALERARLFDAEREARAQAEQAVRSRDEFLSIASHELKTPVAALKGSAQLLLRRLGRGNMDQERLTRSLEVINETSDRLAALTSNLLDVSRIGAGQAEQAMQEFDLVDMVADAVERTGYQLDGEHRIILSVHAQPLVVTADSNRLDQVITNLLENAMKYSPAGGEIVVTVRREGNDAEVSVRDQGIGLPPGFESVIFEPFARASNAVESNLPGIGLGLHIARTIINHHGGRIEAESPGKGEGTTIRVWLPISSTMSTER